MDLVSAGGNEEALLVEASDPGRVVLNRGASHGVEAGHEFLIYDLSAEELEDPESGDSLGQLERVKGTGVVINAQERMCTVELDRGYPARKRVGRKSALQAFPGLEAEEPRSGSSLRPEIGDRAKPMP